ncbi:MAG: DUF3793 family protein [Treponema sp.]|jgi:hypothetical protein|nr:DUF3793 family protein [Treponema sp.]
MTEYLMRRCALTLAGLKCASLFTFPFTDADQLFSCVGDMNTLLNGKGVYVIVLRQQGCKALVYVYRKSRLAEDLAQRGVGEYLRAAGYEDGSVAGCLDRLRNRFEEYEKTGFPHEIGLFLGYPLYDVEGFCAHCGKNHLLCGYWKAYRNVEAAREIFRRYKACEAAYRRQFAQGKSIAQLVVAM